MEFLTPYNLIFPESVLILTSFILILEGVFLKKIPHLFVFTLGVLLALLLIIKDFPENSVALFDKMIVVNQFTQFSKIIIILSAWGSMILAGKWLKDRNLYQSELYILVMLSLVGMLFMVSASHLLSLYLGLELMSLALYVLAAFETKNPKSAESGLKYFITGSLSSCILLYGISIIYGFAGSMYFDVIGEQFLSQININIGVLVGLVLVIIGLAFKISAVPFHQWTPDVYVGAPTPITSLFATAAKVASLVILIRVLYVPLVAFSETWKILLQIMAGLSMLWGAYAALSQDNLKRIMAYSSITNIGYLLGVLSTTTTESISSVLIFLVIYVIMNLGMFASFTLLKINGEYVENISQLRGLSAQKPKLALGIMMIAFSMIGIPPLGGFMGKLFVFNSMMTVQLLHIAVLGVLASVIAAFYYLRIIRAMYFDENIHQYDEVNNKYAKILLFIMVVLVATYIFEVSYLVDFLSNLNLGFGVE